ncbi:hypothetical protein ES703_106543 [subsurface metagenome]
MAIKECPLETRRRRSERTLDISERLKGNALVKQGFTEETAVSEAQRCLGDVRCEYCDLCLCFPYLIPVGRHLFMAPAINDCNLFCSTTQS